jgi:hypothetical protein
VQQRQASHVMNMRMRAYNRAHIQLARPQNSQDAGDRKAGTATGCRARCPS